MDEKLKDLFYQAEHYFFTAISNRFCSFDGYATAYYTAIKDDPLNILFIKNQTPSFRQLLDKASDFFKSDDARWSVEIPEYLCSEIYLKDLAHYGFRPTEIAAAMALPLDIKTLSRSSILNIKPMNDRLDEWVIPLIAYPSTTAEINKDYQARHENALRCGYALNHFSLYEESQVISSLTISLNQELARIDDVATLPEFQAKGYATKLMIYGLNYAAKNGAKYCFLEASQMGLSIYKKLGFNILFENQIFYRTT